MVHIKLITIKRQLQARMNYPLTREEAGEEYMTLDEAFDTLLYGFQRYIDPNSQYMQRGDTSVVIQTRAIESYDASKRM